MYRAPETPGDAQEREVRSYEDAEFLPVAPVTDGWCGPVLHADERSERAWRAMEQDEELERYEDRIWG